MIQDLVAAALVRIEFSEMVTLMVRHSHRYPQAWADWAMIMQQPSTRTLLNANGWDVDKFIDACSKIDSIAYPCHEGSYLIFQASHMRDSS